MKKTVHIIYPEYTAPEYKQALGEINRDIYADNSAYFIPRMFANLLSSLFLSVCLAAGIFVFYLKLSPRMDGTMGEALLFYLIGAACCFLVYLLVILFAAIDIKRKLCYVLHIRSHTETYSLSRFREKHDARKNKYKEYTFREACDRLRGTDIRDIAFHVSSKDGKFCTVCVSYQKEHGSNILEEHFEDIALFHRLQDASKIDLWLDLEKRELSVYTPGAPQNQTGSTPAAI